MPDPAPSGRPMPEPVTTVADLTNEHVGWLIKVVREERYGSFSLPHRTFVLGRGFGNAVRRWTRPDGSEVVGLIDESEKRPGVVGVERAYPPDTPCELVRQVVKPRRRRGGPDA